MNDTQLMEELMGRTNEAGRQIRTASVAFLLVAAGFIGAGLGADSDALALALAVPGMILAILALAGLALATTISWRIVTDRIETEFANEPISVSPVKGERTDQELDQQ